MWVRLIGCPLACNKRKILTEEYEYLRLQREFGLSFWRTFVPKFLFQRLWLLWGCKENLVGGFDLFLCLNFFSDVLLCQNFYFKDFDYSEAAKRIWLEVLICFCVWIFYFLLCLLFKKKKQTKQNKKYSHLNGHWL